MTKEELKIALIQMTSVLDYKKNLEQIENLLEENSQDFDILFLPECFYSISNGVETTPYLVKQGNEHFENIANLAKKYSKYLIGGSVAYDGGEGKVLNRVLNFDPNGNLINFYDKINLFNCDFSKGKSINEADIYTGGEEPQVVEVLGFKIGLAVCFDLRFPNLLLNYYREDVDCITFSSAFTVPTGKAHWHTLLRARAIEGQCYSVACGQWGRNNERISTFGHSLVVNPWGEVISDQKDGISLKVVTLEKKEIQKVKQRITLNFERF